MFDFMCVQIYLKFSSQKKNLLQSLKHQFKYLQIINLFPNFIYQIYKGWGGRENIPPFHPARKEFNGSISKADSQ